MLRAIFYSEFDNIVGPRVIYDAPKGMVSERRSHATGAGRGAADGGEGGAGGGAGESCLFDAISDYSITASQLCGHLITVQAPAFGVQVLTITPTLTLTPTQT